MSKVYYKVIIAAGKERADIQFPSYSIEADSYELELAKDAAGDLAELLTREHGILPDRYWVAYIALVNEEELFRDLRLDASATLAH